MIIDFHTHCFPDSIAKRALTKLAGSADIEPGHDGTLSGLLDSMDEAEIDMSVLMPIATRPEQTQSINNWASSVSSDRVLSFGTIHPGFTGWENELLRIRELGLKGIKFHPEYQSFDVDDDSMQPVYKTASELGLIILFHAGNDFAFEPPCHCPPQKLMHIVDMLPDAKIVAAHLGGFLLWEDVFKYLAGSSVYLDTSFTLGIIEKRLLQSIFKRHGTERILFGTDSPWTEQKRELAEIRKLGLSKDVEKKILCKNAQVLLDI